MKRKFLVTLAMSTVFISAQMAFLSGGVHASPRYSLWATSHAAVYHNVSLESVLAGKKKIKLTNSDGLEDIKELQDFVKANLPTSDPSTLFVEPVSPVTF